ncbi:hypothetical protein HALO59_40079 [Halomonas sp. 59]|nr:hypothetical protein HALOI3_20228 [Halomonas sp. I3]CAD5275536.1 hypothetical protein HALO113_40229 [Halomonas sp. 113]CAD5277270.1 hypothetical protein HALO59_40079 [Halomonas sp. 59]VXC00623.1 hypothetical protein HALO98_40227 [Halomonas titanicae]VXC73019.1 hypothetical protein HALO153_60078 [Halomonas titanicae]
MCYSLSKGYFLIQRRNALSCRFEKMLTRWRDADFLVIPNKKLNADFFFKVFYLIT